MHGMAIPNNNGLKQQINTRLIRNLKQYSHERTLMKQRQLALTNQTQA